jgi:hypothetical protein
MSDDFPKPKRCAVAVIFSISASENRTGMGLDVLACCMGFSTQFIPFLSLEIMETLMFGGLKTAERRSAPP